ncbi:MAG: tetratricopeptide repeat protein [Alphaproteobacteria bacterium]|nr:tetratricopeptide repeat protein [Alphaproteobacteria bacterium]MBV9371233.1 tetratricopeptide repeat protein [Alphaproteobacteria bacterium]MBV9902828.1 tetratricopeptide repeat protein [Alphaproteobacteria bacterium]
MGKRGKLIVAAALAGLLAVPALADPPGGGGGGAAPSMSAPQYDPAAEYRKGIEALQAQRFKEAKAAFEHVLAVAPRDANTNLLAGMSCAGLDDLKNARKYYERAVKADKDLVGARRELALTYLRLGDRPKAEAELAALKALQAACGGACAKAAELGKAVDMVAAALAAPTQARLDTQPSLLFASAAGGDRAYFEAVSLINERRYEEAIGALEAARATFGPHPDILTYLGFANRKLGRYETAERYYRAALAAAPGHRAATEYYGELMVERGDRAGAERMLAKLDEGCTFGCAEAEELRRWIAAGGSPAR